MVQAYQAYQAISTDVLAGITGCVISCEVPPRHHCTDNFNIHDFIPAPSSSHRPTRASQSGKFKHKLYHFYLNRIIRLWNALPTIDMSLPFQSIKHFLFEFLWNHFINHFQSDISCTYHFLCPCSSCSHNY